MTLRLSTVVNRKAFFVCLRMFSAKYAKEREKRKESMTDILYKDESYKIIGACFEVYQRKGFGFSESVYQECLQIEFNLQAIPFEPQPALQLEYRGTPLTQFFKPDFICYGNIIVEIKAVTNLIDAHRSQVLNYLKATEFDLALLINFGHFPKLEHDRIANNMRRISAGSITDELRSWNL